jgi:hypothetical protein
MHRRPVLLLKYQERPLWLQPAKRFFGDANFTFPPQCRPVLRGLTGKLLKPEETTFLTIAGLLKGMGLRSLLDVVDLKVAREVLAWMDERRSGPQSGYKYTRACW